MNLDGNLDRRELLLRGGLGALAAAASLGLDSIEALAETADTLKIVNLNGNLAPGIRRTAERGEVLRRVRRQDRRSSM